MDLNCNQNSYCQEKNYWSDINSTETLSQLTYSSYHHQTLEPCSSQILDYNKHNDLNKFNISCGPSSKKTNLPPPKVFKRRNTANKKERRRTQSINTAFSCLRNKIPNVPTDTKLSKIKTLRLATSYITYLKKVLEGDQDPEKGFQAEIITSSKKHCNLDRKNNYNKMLQIQMLDEMGTTKKIKGRTGWPQDLWASELKHEAKQ